MSSRKGRIDVSAKIIADISSGIYRTPANALKELISNAFDAGAPSIIITTDFPDFKVITAYDNGKGMTVSEFEEVMGRIGGSDKRSSETDDKQATTDFGRPIIGKIGIGILAIAQICQKFTVISSTIDEPTRFEATIDLKKFHEQDAYKYNLQDEIINIGEYDILDGIEDEENLSYTKIILEELDEGFRNRLLGIPEQYVHDFKPKGSDPITFIELIESMKDKKIREVPEYIRLLWELALVSPVPYADNGPVPKNKTTDVIKKRLLSYNFTAIVDGIKLIKPITFPYEEDIEKPYFDHKVYEYKYDGIVADSRLKFSGYIYHRNKSIWPPELRGLMVRIRNVGIGGYDRSFLKYPQSVGVILQSLTGEIYVEYGLEDALNIDRNSFRETDPHYLKLQELIFQWLSKPIEQGGILRDARYRSNQTQGEKKLDRAKEEYKKLSNIIKNIVGKKYKIKISKEKNEVPIYIDNKKLIINIYSSNHIYPRKISDRRLYEKLIIFYELSTQNLSNKKEVDDVFYKLLKGRT